MDSSFEGLSSNENSYIVTDNSNSLNSSNIKILQNNHEQDKKRIESLRKEKQRWSTSMAQIKRQLAEIEIQEEELQREVCIIELVFSA